MTNDPKQKKQRVCAVCGQQASKGQLFRIVRTETGAEFDASGRKSGRGAYVCSQECFDKARKTGKLARALRTKLEHDDYDRIAEGLVQAVQQ